MNNEFKSNTLGYAATEMLEEIVDAEGKTTSFTLKKTEEVKALLAAQEARGANVVVDDIANGSVMQSLTTEAAIEAFVSSQTDRLSNPLAGKPIVDRYRIAYNGGTIEVESSVMKSISANMSRVVEGTLSSTRMISQAANNQTNNKAGIKDNLVRSNVPIFEARQESNVNGVIVKSIDIQNVSIGVPLDFGSLHDYDTLNALIAGARNACEAKTIDTYLAYGEEHPNDQIMYRTALRLQNRNLVDSIFQDVYCSHYDEPNVHDKENFKRFLDLRKRFHANLNKIGQGSNISSYTYKLGIERVDVITGKEQDVSSVKRIGSVKRNQVGSFVHIKPQDTGICVGVFSDIDKRNSFINSYGKMWLAVAAKWLQNEARAMLNLPTIELSDKEVTSISKPRHEDVSAAEALQIDSSCVDDIQDDFIKRTYELSESVITEDRIEVNKEYVKTLGNIYN